MGDSMINEITRAIDEIVNKKGSCIVAIDGRCGSGKTTLAADLKKYYNCNVIHMDDFFLQPHQRTEERLGEIGGNVDYERFFSEVLLPLGRNERFSYRPFDCSTFKLGEPINVNVCSVTVVEGSYSCHPYLFDAYDLHVFLDIEPNVQLERIEKRNGKEALEVFKAKWIPLEETYFKYLNVKEKCEIRL